jgi:hypothetical protein
MAPGICAPLMYQLIFDVQFSFAACLATCPDNLCYDINLYTYIKLEQLIGNTITSLLSVPLRGVTDVPM